VSRFCGSDGRDNGEAGAGGQPPQAAFPKGFTGVMRRTSEEDSGTSSWFFGTQYLPGTDVPGICSLRENSLRGVVIQQQP
jgi:hypothetical protein